MCERTAGGEEKGRKRGRHSHLSLSSKKERRSEGSFIVERKSEKKGEGEGDTHTYYHQGFAKRGGEKKKKEECITHQLQRRGKRGKGETKTTEKGRGSGTKKRRKKKNDFLRKHRKERTKKGGKVSKLKPEEEEGRNHNRWTAKKGEFEEKTNVSAGWGKKRKGKKHATFGLQGRRRKGKGTTGDLFRRATKKGGRGKRYSMIFPSEKKGGKEETTEGKGGRNRTLTNFDAKRRKKGRERFPSCAEERRKGKERETGPLAETEGKDGLLNQQDRGRKKGKEEGSNSFLVFTRAEKGFGKKKRTLSLPSQKGERGGGGGQGSLFNSSPDWGKKKKVNL